MFDLDAGKLIVIAIVALIAIPAKDLPRVLRQLGKWSSKMRRMAAEFQDQFMTAIRDAELRDVRKELHEAALKAREDVSFDPIAGMREQITNAVEPKQPKQPEQPAPQGSVQGSVHEGAKADAAFDPIADTREQIAGTLETKQPAHEDASK